MSLKKNLMASFNVPLSLAKNRPLRLNVYNLGSYKIILADTKLFRSFAAP